MKNKIYFLNKDKTVICDISDVGLVRVYKCKYNLMKNLQVLTEIYTGDVLNTWDRFNGLTEELKKLICIWELEK